MRTIRIPSVVFACLSALTVTHCGRPTAPSASSIEEAWNPANDPLRLDGTYQRRLDDLPLTGAVATKPWSDTYWPSTQGGLAARWKTTDDAFAYPMLTRDAAAQLSLADRARLSPAEKFDLYNGRYDFPTVVRERARTSPRDASWEGLCHGWAAAAINFAEPHAVLMTNADGLQVPFGSSDIKALLTYYQGQIGRAPLRMLGSRCRIDLGTFPDGGLAPECRDTNAGSFHVVLTNQLGLMRQPFIADVSRDVQVWNQPIHAFSSQILGYQEPTPGAAPGTVREAIVDTSMTYTAEVSAQWNALLNTDGHKDSERRYQYRLELDANGAIIGGEWQGEARPDFLWKHAKPAFTGYWRAIEPIFAASQTDAVLADPTLDDSVPR